MAPAYTEFGGDVLPVEVNLMRGKGQLATGQLGDVMKESAQAALSCCGRVPPAPDQREVFAETDIHACAAGAVPKDGPSAGITMATALASAFTNRAVRKDLAMTGEIAPARAGAAGRWCQREDPAAHRAGVRTVILRREPEGPG